MPHTNTRNTIRTIVVALAAAVFALADAREARAAVVTFSDLNAFLTALDGASRTTETFLSVPPTTVFPNPVTLNGLTYTFTGGPYSNDPNVGGFGNPDGRISANYNAWSTGGVPENSLAANRANAPPFDPNAAFNFTSRDGATQFQPGERITVTSARPLNAIGVFFNADPASATGDVRISLPQLGLDPAAGNVAGTAVFDPIFGNPNDPTDRTLFFVGLISDTPFTTAVFSARDYNNTTQGTLFTLNHLITSPGAATGAVPEPGTIAVFGALTLTGLAVRRRRVAAGPQSPGP